MLQQALENPLVVLMILAAFGLLVFAIHLGMPHRAPREFEPRAHVEPKRRAVREQMLINVVMFSSFLLAVPVTIIIFFWAAALAGLIIKPGWAAIFGSQEGTFRNWLEIGAFTANILVAGVAWFAVRFASSQAYETRRQAWEAERARSAQVHLHITGRYISERVSRSRVTSFHLYRGFKPGGPYKSAAEYYHHELIRLRGSSEREDTQTYLEHIEILCFFEDVGMLVEKRYVLLDDIRKLFAGPILGAREIFAHHLAERRKKETKLFDNFLRLCDEIEKAEAAEASHAASLRRKAGRAFRFFPRFARTRVTNGSSNREVAT